ncbi:hypothetical protein ACWGNZ_07165 [Sphingomonas zeae]
MTKEAEQALIALEHCGVIRVRFDHPGYLELFDGGIATITPVDGDDDALDYRIAQ